jgi:hypothetical protein
MIPQAPAKATSASVGRERHSTKGDALPIDAHFLPFVGWRPAEIKIPMRDNS